MNTYKLPIHLIRQYLFCPRVVYFLEVLNIPKASPIWVKMGEKYHEDQLKLFKRRTLQRFHLEEATFKSSVSLQHESVNFYGICDGLIVSQTDVYPIEMKLHGTKPTKSQKAQLIAYGILAQQKFSKQFNQGFFLFEQKGKTVPFKVTQDQKSELIELVEEIIKMIKSGKLPYSNASDEQCSQCEFENYCNDRF